MQALLALRAGDLGGHPLGGSYKSWGTRCVGRLIKGQFYMEFLCIFNQVVPRA